MSSLKKRETQLQQLQAQAQPHLKALSYLRAVQSMNVLQQQDVEHIIALVGRMTLGHWQLDNQIQAAKAELKELTPEPLEPPTEPPAPEASDADDSTGGH